MLDDTNYWSSLWCRPVSRRQVLRLASRTGMGLAGVALLGCAAPSAPATKAPAGSPAPAATPTPPQPVYGGTLIQGTSNNMGLDPHIGILTGYDRIAQYLVYNSLIHDSKESKLEPELATSWEIPDLTTFIFKLRPDPIKFHDGADFNAQAVKLTFDRVLEEGFKPTGARELSQLLKSTQVVDDRTVKVTIKSPNPEFLGQALAKGEQAFIISPLAPAKYKNDLRQFGVGTGPFVSKEWVLDDHITVEKFPGYWQKGLPYLDRVNWRIVLDPLVHQTMLKTGDIHFVLDIPVKDVAPLKADPNIVVKIEPGVKRKTVDFNMVKEPFSKKAARQALAYAVDRKAMVDAIYQGVAPVADGIYPPSHWAYDPTVKGYPYDPQKAKEKLVEAGYPNGFEFKAVTAPVRPDEVQACEILQSMLAKVGIKMDFQVVENARKMDIWYNDTKEFDAIVTEAGDSTQPITLIKNYYTRLSGRSKHSDVPFPELEDLLAKATNTYNIDEQRPFLQKADRLITENVWSEWSYAYGVNIFAYRKNVMNYEHGAHPYAARFRKVWLSK